MKEYDVKPHGTFYVEVVLVLAEHRKTDNNSTAPIIKDGKLIISATDMSTIFFKATFNS